MVIAYHRLGNSGEGFGMGQRMPSALQRLIILSGVATGSEGLALNEDICVYAVQEYVIMPVLTLYLVG